MYIFSGMVKETSLMDIPISNGLWKVLINYIAVRLTIVDLCISTALRYRANICLQP